MFDHSAIVGSVHCRSSPVIIFVNKWSENLFPRDTVPHNDFRRFLEWPISNESRIFLSIKSIVPAVHMPVHIEVCFVGENDELQTVGILLKELAEL